MTHPYFKDRDAFINEILAGLQPKAAPSANAVADDYLANANLGDMGAPLAALAQQGAMPAGTAADVMSQFAPSASGAIANEPLADAADYSRWPELQKAWENGYMRRYRDRAKQRDPEFLHYDPRDPEGRRAHETEEEYERRTHPDPRVYPPARRT